MRSWAPEPQHGTKRSWNSRTESWDWAPELCTLKYRRLRPNACSGSGTRCSLSARRGPEGRGARGRCPAQ
eukprot:3327571-Alexandrium_andersonii.AAC.1